MTNRANNIPADFSEDAASYALNAMDASERASFEASATEEDWQQVRKAQQVASELSAVRPLAPPAALKSRLLEQIKNTPQESATGVYAPQLAQAAHRFCQQEADASDVPQNQQAKVIDPFTNPKNSAQRAAQARWSRAWAPLALLGAAATIVAGGWGITQYQQLQDARGQILALQEQTQQTSLVEQISMASDVSLAKGTMNGSTISVVYSPSHNMASIASSNLPQLPAGKAYVIWLYNAQGTIVGSGTLNEGSLGEVLTEMTNQDLSQVTDFGITVENITATAPSEKPMMLEVMDN